MESAPVVLNQDLVELLTQPDLGTPVGGSVRLREPLNRRTTSDRKLQMNKAEAVDVLHGQLQPRRQRSWADFNKNVGQSRRFAGDGR